MSDFLQKARENAAKMLQKQENHSIPGTTPKIPGTTPKIPGIPGKPVPPKPGMPPIAPPKPSIPGKPTVSKKNVSETLDTPETPLNKKGNPFIKKQQEPQENVPKIPVSEMLQQEENKQSNNKKITETLSQNVKAVQAKKQETKKEIANKEINQEEMTKEVTVKEEEIRQVIKKEEEKKASKIKEQPITENKEEVTEEIKETKEKIKEEIKEDNKKNKKKHSKEKHVTDSEAFEIPETEVSFDEATSAIRSKFNDSEWEEFKEKITKDINDVSIRSDMNTIMIKETLAQLDIIRSSIWHIFTDTKTVYEGLVSKEPEGLLERVKKLSGRGNNAEERKQAGIIAAMHYKHPTTKKNINLYELIDEYRERFNFLKNATEAIQYKNSILVTMLGSLKLEK